MDSVKEESKEKCGTLVPTFPLARFTYSGNYQEYYYPFGNTPAEDFLENCLDNSHPFVLVLGCGDLRSCFYTLWKNFDSSISTAPKKFKGVCFTLNDCSAAILARNIIFLYLCLHLPEDSTEKKKWLSAMWAIWYCHELYPDHLDILNVALKALLEFSDSTKLWSSKGNPLHQLVRFTSPSCLFQVADVWSKWLHRTGRNTSVEKMHKSRNQVIGKSIINIANYSCELAKFNLYVYGDEEKVQAEKAAARAPEVRSYLKVGSCYAEHIADLNLPEKLQTEVNLTMYERQDGRYTCHFGLMPFLGYHHAVEFSPQFMASNKIDIPYDIIVSSASFKSKPFLANSFQQFSLWLQSSSSILKDENAAIMFSIDCQDAITCCQQQMKCKGSKYDIITTSNLMDHLSPSNLVLACVPLLKDDGLLITTSMRCRNIANTGEEFLNVCFGFDSKLFPVVLGVRCISHEGSNYSNPVIINPLLPDLSHMGDRTLHVRTFVWVNVSNAQKFTFPQLPRIKDDNITEALINLVGSCAYGLLNRGFQNIKRLSVLSHNCIETALGMLERFKCISDESTLDYTYWEPLCTNLKQVASPFLHCFQTQAQLHNIHVHLTISKEDCHVCQQKEIASTLGLFSVVTEKPSTAGGKIYFLALVHRHHLRTSDPNLLLSKAQEGKDVHIFDAFVYDSTLQLKFFAPLIFAQKGYFVTVVTVTLMAYLYLGKIDYKTLSCTELSKIKMPWKRYDLYRPELSSQSDSEKTNALFGTVISHACDSHKSETKISLSKASSETLSTTKLSTEKISSSQIRLNCNSLTFVLNFSYPINYDRIKMEINSGVLTLSCERQCYSLEEERPCFIVIPDHQLCPVPYNLNAKVVYSQSFVQMTRKESSQTDSEVKMFLQLLFQQAMCHSFFSISFERNICILIVVNKVLFDYQHKTPAIDLVFCSVYDIERLDILEKWESVLRSLRVQPKHLSLNNEAELEYLKKVLGYFSRRTNGTLLSAGSTSKYAILQNFDLDCAFTRCVLYFLLHDPDVYLNAESNPIDYSSSCAYCRKASFLLKKCKKCETILYCNQICQQKHLPKHLFICNFIREWIDSSKTLCVHVQLFPSY